ncbi:MAG TPA: hypothetical protein DHW14_04765 [Clostridiales bacterium]|nr:hypothetical protein [Clostridiales bacterium]
MLRYLVGYLSYIRSFSTDAKLYLWSSFLGSVASGLTQVVFNLYLLRLGYEESFLGMLIFYTSMAGVVFALPAGRVSDHFGRRKALLVSGAVGAGGVLAQVLLPVPGVLLAAAVLSGGAWTVSMVTSAPLLVETSRDHERAHLFGLHSALMMGSWVVGSNLGGLLPRFFGGLYGVGQEAALPLQATLLVGVGLWLAALVPLFGLRETTCGRPPVRTAGSLWWPRLSAPRLTLKILIPTVLTGLGAGMIIPLQNVFMDQYLGATPAQIGLIFSIGSLLTGLGALVAPLLAERWGKVRAAVGSQFLSLPFLAVMGLVPHLGVYAVASLIRGALMNLANPLITNFQMEIVPAHERATVNSLINMCWNLGWAFCGWAGGWVMQNISYTLPYGITFVLYALAVALFYRFFRAYEPVPGAGRGRAAA